MRVGVVRTLATASGISSTHPLLDRAIATQGAGEVVGPCPATQRRDGVIVTEVAARVVALFRTAFCMLSSLLGRQGIVTTLLGVQVVESVVTERNNLTVCAEVAGAGISPLTTATCLVSANPRVKGIVTASKLRWVVLLLVTQGVDLLLFAEVIPGIVALRCTALRS